MEMERVFSIIKRDEITEAEDLKKYDFGTAKKIATRELNRLFERDIPYVSMFVRNTRTEEIHFIGNSSDPGRR